MNDLLILVFLVCGEPVYVEFVDQGVQMKFYRSSDLKPVGQWESLLKDIAALRAAGLNYHELKIEDETKVVCGTKT